MARTSYKSIDAYIASKPKETRLALERVRKAIRRALPSAEEGMSYQIPVFRLNDVPVLYFAGWKEPFVACVPRYRAFRKSSRMGRRPSLLKRTKGVRDVR